MQRSNGSSMVPAGLAQLDRWRYSIAGIVLLGLVLRLVRLNFQPLWWDEGWSLYFATTGVGNMMQLTAVDIHPPLYYLLLHAWIGLFGPKPISVRLLSVFIGAASIPLLYAVGKRLFRKTAGLLAALLLAVSPFHIYYSQEVRMYGLVTLFGLGALYFALRWESGIRESALRDVKAGSLAGYVISATAALYTQYYAAFLLLALSLGILLRSLRRSSPQESVEEEGRRTQVPAPFSSTRFRGKRGIVWAWLGAQFAVLLLYLPWLWYAGAKLLTYVQFKVSVEQYPPMGLLEYLGRHLAAFDWGHAEGGLGAWWWAGLLPLLAVALALAPSLWHRVRTAGLGKADRGNGAWLALIPIVLLISGFAVNLVFPFNPEHGERLLLLALPAYLLAIAAALAFLARRRRRAGLLVAGTFLALGVVSLAFFYTVPRYPDDDYRPVADRLQALALPTDAVVCVHPWQVGYFEAYLPASRRPSLVLTPREVLPRERQLWADDPGLMAADLDALLAGHTRIWLPAHQAMGQILEHQIERYLTQQSYPVLSEWHGENTVLSLFASGQAEALSVAARFGGWLDLRGAALSPGPLQAGWGVAAVDLDWQLSERPADPYTVSLRLVGPTGHVWAQRDAAPMDGLAQFSSWPPGQLLADRHGLLVPAGTPPGDYRVVLQVYRSKDVTVLPATFEGGSGGEVTLGTVHVVRPDSAPPVEALSFQQACRVTFGGRLRLLGFSLNSEPLLRPGESIAVDLDWQALVDPGEDFLPRLELRDADGNVWAERTEKPVAGTYPTAWWQADDLVRDPHALPIPATVPAGHYTLALSLVRAANNQPVSSDKGQTTILLAEIDVQGREHAYEPVRPAYIQAAQFGDGVSLIGYDLSGDTLSPGASLEVTLVWHPLATPGQNLEAFVHLLDGDGNIVTQDDSVPGNGTLPTMGWLPGEYVSDPHLLQIPSGLTPGPYRLEVGLYDPATGIRLGDGVVLDKHLTLANN
jgi:4-amino-4-deoxy-L-arabinose transferase-like glycosyltransferase